MIPKRILLSVMDYDPDLKAKVIPWAHRFHAWVGLAYVFDDPDHQDMLVYMTSNWNGDYAVRIHQTKITPAVNEDGSLNITLGSDPDPDEDTLIRSFKLE